VKSDGSEACFIFLTAPWNYILFLGESKNGDCDKAIENCTFGEHPAVLANKSIYWPSPPLASESEQITTPTDLGLALQYFSGNPNLVITLPEAIGKLRLYYSICSKLVYTARDITCRAFRNI
jgi:hypothetical protein